VGSKSRKLSVVKTDISTLKNKKKKKKGPPKELTPEIITEQLQYLLENPDDAGELKLSDAVWIARYAGLELTITEQGREEYPDPEQDHEVITGKAVPHLDWAAALTLPPPGSLRGGSRVE